MVMAPGFNFDLVCDRTRLDADSLEPELRGLDLSRVGRLEPVKTRASKAVYQAILLLYCTPSYSRLPSS